MAEDLLIMVDTQDRPLGPCKKMQAHQSARLHRAFPYFFVVTVICSYSVELPANTIPAVCGQTLAVPIPDGAKHWGKRLRADFGRN